MLESTRRIVTFKLVKASYKRVKTSSREYMKESQMSPVRLSLKKCDLSQDERIHSSITNTG